MDLSAILFPIFTLLGGLAFFLYGMNAMSGGLEKLAGGKMEKTLKKMTANKFASMGLGAGITIAMQSSSALTVMLVGLVNSGIMALEQTVGVIFGSNIGTTLTAWILSLAGIESGEGGGIGNFLISLLKPANFSPIVALIGIILIMMSKSERKKDIGTILVGFAVLMFGMQLMGDAVKPLAADENIETFKSFISIFNNPFVGVAVGAIFTGIIQSSAASVGILQTLAIETKAITFNMAIPIIMGQNIGTCVTSLISSIGVTKNAKRVAAVHVLFNIIGTVVVLIIYLPIYLLVEPIKNALSTNINAQEIALCHTIFNTFTTFLLVPFTNLLVYLAKKIIPDAKEEEKQSFIDERLLNTPSFALAECDNHTVKMAKLARETFLNATNLARKAENGDGFDEKLAEQVRLDEKSLDKYEDKLGSFLVKISSKDLSQSDSHEVSKLLHTIGDFERIGDHAVNLLGVAKEIADKNISFSEQAREELKILSSALEEIITITVTAFEENNLELAKDVEPLEQVVDSLTARIKANHISRLQKGDCTIELGFVLSDLLNNFERVSDHCSNIAVAMIEVAHDSFDTHKYLKGIKSETNADFSERYNEYDIKYKLF
ncbi:MAG: Na/Pi cotransporter family protein [Ruminococcaceae bacterium]|nr:Na/Pi cotransporter family protein [Oscillospiraceae bacterium]